MQERGRSEFADVIGQCPEPASGEISTVIYDVNLQHDKVMNNF